MTDVYVGDLSLANPKLGRDGRWSRHWKPINELNRLRVEGVVILLLLSSWIKYFNNTSDMIQSMFSSRIWSLAVYRLQYIYDNSNSWYVYINANNKCWFDTPSIITPLKYLLVLCKFLKPLRPVPVNRSFTSSSETVFHTDWWLIMKKKLLIWELKLYWHRLVMKIGTDLPLNKFFMFNLYLTLVVRNSFIYKRVWDHRQSSQDWTIRSDQNLTKKEIGYVWPLVSVRFFVS